MSKYKIFTKMRFLIINIQAKFFSLPQRVLLRLKRKAPTSSEEGSMIGDDDWLEVCQSVKYTS